jgi:type IV fimbrial biogenesis protein FimT
MKAHHGRRPHGCRGLTFVELLVTITVAAVLLAVAIPSFSAMLHASRLRGAEDNLKAHLRYAMAESVKRNRSISVTFKASTDGAMWCYGMSEASSCDCGVAGSCVYDAVERVVRSADYTGVGVTVSVSNGRFSFQPKRNTVTAGSITFTAASGKKLRTVASGYGRIRVCSPAGDGYLAGYPEC